MASNFDFLRDRYPSLFEPATQAESLIYAAPRASCFYARFALEQAVHWLYKNDTYLRRLCRKYFLVTNEVSRSHSVKR